MKDDLTPQSRKLYLDLIRIIAIFMVLYNHRTTYACANEIADKTLVCYFIQLMATICRCGVPLYFMVSGVVLLGKDEGIGYVLKHRLLRIVIVMIGCTIIRGWGDFGLYNLLSVFFTKLNWYLYAYFDYLLMLPLLRGMVVSIENNGLFYIVLVFVYYSISGILIFKGLYTGLIDFAPLYNTQFASLCWGIIFSVSGFWLEKNKLHKKDYALLFLVTIISLLLSTSFVIKDIINNNGTNIEQLRLHFIYAPTLLIFVLIKNAFESEVFRFLNSCLARRIVVSISGATFGIFIIETHSELINLINWKLSESFLSVYLSGYWLGWISMICQFFICLVLTYTIKRIPFLNKLL